MKNFLLLLILTLASSVAFSQKDYLDASNSKTYTVGGITVLGAVTTDVQAIKLFAGIREGDQLEIPGDRIPKAIRNLWNQDLFSDITISAPEIRGESIYLLIEVEERARIYRKKFSGVKKGEGDDLNDEIGIVEGRIANENFKTNTINQVKNYFIEKGYLNVEVSLEETPVSNPANSVLLNYQVKKGARIKINEIIFNDLTAFSEKKVEKKLKNTKEKRFYRIFKRSKFINRDFQEDLETVVQLYNSKGYRNAKIVSDTVYRHDERTVDIRLEIKEGEQFYFRDIEWLGNTKYDTDRLSDRLGIEKGDIYDKTKLEERLFMSQDGGDVSSLYLDNGYLSFSAVPIETAVENDSIDIEVRIYEGKQYRVNAVTISGNEITNDHVIMREIRTRPGDLFSRSDLMRTQRELAQLGYFDPAGFAVNPVQNPLDGTVDIEYTVQEKPSDQIELQGGWGGGRLVGTFGVSFNNFSLKNIFNGEAWRPVPKGDGQRLSVRLQTNGSFFRAYNMSFVEPWLGGRKPNSLSFSLQHSVQTNGLNQNESNSATRLAISGGSIGLGKRLTWPDDYFQMLASISYQHYELVNFGNIFTFANGSSNNLAISAMLARDSRSGNPIFFSSGSRTTMSTKFTPLGFFNMNKDFSDATDQEKFDWVEYHKWKFTSEWYTPLTKRDDDFNHKLVLFTKVGAGYLGRFNNTIGDSPFERFYLGGSALTGFQLDGREIIALRGYDDLSLSPNTGSTFINKYTMEMRYLVSPNPSATIYGLGFVEAGQTWDDFTEFDPLLVKRSAGVGLRIFLPMFGLMGLDYGWRFDDVPNNPQMPRGQFHFTIGMNLGEL